MQFTPDSSHSWAVVTQPDGDLRPLIGWVTTETLVIHPVWTRDGMVTWDPNSPRQPRLVLVTEQTWRHLATGGDLRSN